MKKHLQKQIELLKKYNVSNYSIENDSIVINGSLDLHSLQSADKDFLKETTINGSLDLNSLQSADKDFLKEATINRWLDLSSLQSADKDFLKGTTINGWLYLNSLQSADKDFLKGATINGSLYLSSLQSADKDFLKGTTINGSLGLRSLQSADKAKILRNNVRQLKPGYNKMRGYCYFDGILSKVLSVSERKGYTIFTSPFEYIVKKGKYTAHGKTVKKAIQDVEFKIIAEKLKKEPIQKDTKITVQYYRLLTGACDAGIRQWMQNHNIAFTVENDTTVETKPMKAGDLMPLLEKSNAYGLDKIKALMQP